jgi:hypothetical protein
LEREALGRFGFGAELRMGGEDGGVIWSRGDEDTTHGGEDIYQHWYVYYIIGLIHHHIKRE